MTQMTRFKNLEDFGFGPNVMKNTKVCSKCGQAIKASAIFCSSCGEKLPQETLFDHYKKQHICCPDCDTVLAIDSQYCPNCGKQILLKVTDDEKGGGLS